MIILDLPDDIADGNIYKTQDSSGQVNPVLIVYYDSAKLMQLLDESRHLLDTRVINGNCKAVSGSNTKSNWSLEMDMSIKWGQKAQ